MGYIEVATDDDGLPAVELLEVAEEVVLPLHAVVETAQTVLAVRGIDGDEVEVRHLQRDDASFVVVLVDADAVGDGEGFVAREDGCAAIAFLVGVVPIGTVAREGEV